MDFYGLIRFRFEFKLQDMWVGVYWLRSLTLRQTDIWICLLPCLPLHITVRDFTER